MKARRRDEMRGETMTDRMRNDSERRGCQVKRGTAEKEERSLQRGDDFVSSVQRNGAGTGAGRARLELSSPRRAHRSVPTQHCLC
ncbi:unnamed protein product [Lota lota]